AQRTTVGHRHPARAREPAGVGAAGGRAHEELHVPHVRRGGGVRDAGRGRGGGRRALPRPRRAADPRGGRPHHRGGGREDHGERRGPRAQGGAGGRRARL
ncbi:MAG: hypothetical protein AVDCRST_MAG11-3011, partial [uncultured Gemmatimonadaceae bacterium]